MTKKIISFLVLWGWTFSFSFAGDNAAFYNKLLAQAPHTVGLTKFPRINDKFYRGDCSGFIAFLFHWAGLDFLKLYGIGNNGVAAIWNGLEQRNYIIQSAELQPGDIVFFDNTYDKNRNLRWDDKLTHIGVVESVDELGTATFLHYGSKGVVRARMNLQQPKIHSIREDGKVYVMNDYLRRRSRGEKSSPKHLSGALYKGAARIYLQKKKTS